MSLNLEQKLHLLKNLKTTVIKRFNPFKSRSAYGCPALILSLGSYVGCSYSCRYCYARIYVKKFQDPHPVKDFRKNLEKDIAYIKKCGLGDILISISNSSDPLQPLEDRHGNTKYALQRLTQEDFRSVVLTKNPLKLAEYKSLINPKQTVIQATIPFLNPNLYFEPYAPPPAKRINGIRQLIKSGFTVTVRVDPIIPAYRGLPGQTPDELRALIEKLSDIGVRYIVSKTLKRVSARSVRKYTLSSILIRASSVMVGNREPYILSAFLPKH